jgi:hypothetical protein
VTTDDILAALCLPPQSLINLRVTKKELGERVATPADRRLASDLVESCTWVATLTPTTCALAAVTDDERDYQEIPILTVVLHGAERRARLHEALHRSIPYPMLLISAGTDATLPLMLSVATQRRARNGTTEVVLAGPPITTADQALSSDFLDSLAVGHGNPADLAGCYHGWIARIEALHAAAITGFWRLPRTPTDAERRQRALLRHAEVTAEIAAVCRQAATTRQLNQQVASNLALQALRQRLHTLTIDLTLEPIP